VRRSCTGNAMHRRERACTAACAYRAALPPSAAAQRLSRRPPARAGRARGGAHGDVVVVLDVERAQVVVLVKAAALQVLVDGQLAHRLCQVHALLRARRAGREWSACEALEVRGAWAALTAP